MKKLLYIFLLSSMCTVNAFAAVAAPPAAATPEGMEYARVAGEMNEVFARNEMYREGFAGLSLEGLANLARLKRVSLLALQKFHATVRRQCGLAPIDYTTGAVMPLAADFAAAVLSEMAPENFDPFLRAIEELRESDVPEKEFLGAEGFDRFASDSGVDTVILRELQTEMRLRRGLPPLGAAWEGGGAAAPIGNAEEIAAADAALLRRMAADEGLNPQRLEDDGFGNWGDGGGGGGGGGGGADA